MNLIDIINLDFSPEAYVTVLVMALFTGMAVEAFIKPSMEPYKSQGSRYELALNTSALAWAMFFSYLGLVAAGMWGEITAAIFVQTMFRGFVAFFLAVFGYKGFNGIYKRVSGGGEPQ